LANILFFIKRDKTGNYSKYSTYEQLYSEKNNTDKQRRKWENPFKFISVTEKNAAYQLTKSEADITNNDLSFERMVKIGTWIISKFRECKVGKPTDSLSELPMLEQLKAITERKSPIWCGNYANMFLFFCKASSIETRIIEIINPGNHHVVNECFIPELQKWVIVDLTNNIIYCKNEKADFLNTLDLVRSSRKKEKVILYHSANDTIVSKSEEPQFMAWNNYLINKPDIFYYYKINMKEVYSSKNKIKRYLLPISFFEIYSENPVSNFWFFVRLFFIAASILLFIYLFIRFLKSLL